MLLAESDVDEFSGVPEPGSSAAVLVWENTWAAPFGAAVRRSGGQLVASGRIPTQAVLAAMDADRAAKTEDGSLTCRYSETGRTGRACSAEAATGATIGVTGVMTGKTVGVASLDCSGNREPEDRIGHATYLGVLV